MDTKNRSIKVSYSPANSALKDALIFHMRINTDEGIDQLIRYVKVELRRRIAEKQLPKAYRLRIESDKIPFRIQHKSILWKYWFRHRLTGVESNAQFIEVSSGFSPTRSFIEKNSRLAEFPDIWALQIMQTSKRKINGKWLDPEKAKLHEKERGLLIVEDKVEGKNISRMINRDGDIRKELIRNPDYREESEVRFSWKFLLAS